MNININEELKNFIREAKLNGYGQESEKVIVGRDGDFTTIIYPLRGSKYTYEDMYIGSKNFFGREIVYAEYQPEKILYAMSYGVKEIISFEENPDIGKCLASALKAGAEAGLPRGPVVGFSGDYKYVSNVVYYNDNFFTGHEEIVNMITGEIVFTCNFQGGIPE